MHWQLHLTSPTPKCEHRRSTGTNEVKTLALYNITQQYQHEEDKIPIRSIHAQKNWNCYKAGLTSIKYEIHSALVEIYTCFTT